MFDGDQVLARALLDANAPLGGVDTTTAAAAGVCCASAASLAFLLPCHLDRRRCTKICAAACAM